METERIPANCLTFPRHCIKALVIIAAPMLMLWGNPLPPDQIEERNRPWRATLTH